MSRFPLLAGMAAALLAVHIPFALAQISPQVGTGAETEMFQAVLHAAPDGTTALYLADSNTNAPIGGADIQAQAGEWQGAGQPTP